MGAGRGHRSFAGSSAGFTLVELVITMLVLGLLLGIGAFSYANISQGMNLQAAKKQVEAAITRAKLSARQENVEYHITFHADGGANANTYEFHCYMYDEGEDAWKLEPTDKSVSNERVIASGGHYYVEVVHSVKITSGATIVFKPTGTEQTVTSVPAGGVQTIGLLSGSKSGTVSVDAQGMITVD